MKKNLLKGFQIPLSAFRFAGVDYSPRFRKCGKSNCKCAQGGDFLHGPYWYARDDGQEKYVGKELPVEVLSLMAFRDSNKALISEKISKAAKNIRSLKALLEVQENIKRSMECFLSGDSYFDGEIVKGGVRLPS